MQSQTRAGSGPAPQAGEFIGRIVVVYGTGIYGFFEYSGTPAKGNPPEAWAVPPGVTTDPYGNPLPVSGGFATEAAGGAISQMLAGAVYFYSGGTYQPGSVGAAGAGGLLVSSPLESVSDSQAVFQLLSETASGAGHPVAEIFGTTTLLVGGTSPVTSALLEVQGTAAVDSISAIVSGALETQHAFTGANSWAQSSGQVTWGYRMMADGTVEIVGQVTVPAGFAAGQQMSAATPAAYQPAHAFRLTAWDTTTNEPVTIAYQANGELVFHGPVANTAAGDGLLIVPARINLTA